MRGFKYHSKPYQLYVALPQLVEYNAGLKQRGSLTFWISEDVLKQWIVQAKTGRCGFSFTYTDTAIATMATVKSLAYLAGRRRKKVF